MEKEIGLIDYIKVLFKQKWVILGVTFVFGVLSVIAVLQKKDSYKGSVVLEIGRMYVFQKGNLSLLNSESASQIKDKVEKRGYDSLIKENINFGNIFKIEASSNKENNILEIQVIGSNKDDVLNYLKSLSSVIVSENNNIFRLNKNYLENEIKQEREKIASLEKDVNLPSLQSLYNEHLLRLNDLETSLNSIKESSVIKEPFLGIFYTSRVITLISGILLGLFFGVILAFVVDFWQKNKKEILGK